MIESVDVAGLVRFADHPLVRARLAGMSIDARRACWPRSGLPWRETTTNIAVFEHHRLGQYRATVLDIDNANDFAWEVLAHLFANTDAQTVTLDSVGKEAGHQFGATPSGLALSVASSAPWQWRLELGIFESQRGETNQCRDFSRSNRSRRRCRGRITATQQPTRSPTEKVIPPKFRGRRKQRAARARTPALGKRDGDGRRQIVHGQGGISPAISQYGSVMAF